jgi:hypothetical protein
MFRKAYVRGVNKALVDTGAVKYASEELAAEAADAVAETLPEQPVEEVAPEQTAELATTLVELSNQLGEASESAAAAAEEVAGGGEAAAPAPEVMPEEVAKAAAARTEKAAQVLRMKLGQNPTGSTITGEKPHQRNTEPLSENAEAKMDLANRPENYANVGEIGVGIQEASGEGAIGEENVVQGTGMGPVGEDGTNSATDAIKGASLRNLIKKVAQGTTITGDKPEQQNTQAQSAQVTGEGAMEAKNRPEDYAVKGEDGVGNSDQQAQERASAVGTEQAHPGTMGPVGKPGSNSAIEQIPNGKTAEDEEWLKQFKATSAKYAHVLPFWMDDNEKIAAVQFFMGLSPSEAISIASHIEKTAELPEALKAYVEKKKGDGEEKKEEKADEKKEEKKDEEESKEASLKAGDIIQRLRRLNA